MDNNILLGVLGFFQAIIIACVGAWVAVQANRKERSNAAESAKEKVLDEKEELIQQRMDFKDEIIDRIEKERDQYRQERDQLAVQNQILLTENKELRKELDEYESRDAR